jgi:hypothetical protein
MAVGASAAWRGALVMALASAALVALPRTALSPELSPALHASYAALAQMGPMAHVEPMPVAHVATEGTKRPQRSQPPRPASTIDDEVRLRAIEAVARSLESEAG